MAKDKATGSRERITAIHEAGHAVAAYFLRQRILRATIVPKADSRGHVKSAPLKFAEQGRFDDSLRGIDRAEKYIIGCYAGPIAQRKVAPRSRWRVSGRHDFETASKLLSHLEGADDKYNRLYAALLWRRAELVVEMRWKAIKAVADDLLKHRTLDPGAVRAAIDRAHGLKPWVGGLAPAGEA